MIREAKQCRTAIVGIFHDVAVRDAVADRLYQVTPIQDF
jgi:alpha-D-ribose 1-methylphosphonate 5-triphosphate synthase subunit PhnL